MQRAPKQLILEIIEREKILSDKVAAMDAVGIKISGIEPAIDLIWRAAGIDPSTICEFDDPVYNGMGAGDTPEAIYEAMRRRVAEVAI